ncbi:hypothetical protein C2845_PM05G10520 [Panicum miliaceum]|uniref:Uncharacterized protein n=1 Tax=Panicum miliaceum TaxID=4540 RepID=A0A3L6T1Y1_PANMI|nr:hypothetical protein C2845_PM05G10520 [Panicum miliaceum]
MSGLLGVACLFAAACFAWRGSARPTVAHASPVRPGSNKGQRRGAVRGTLTILFPGTVAASCQEPSAPPGPCAAAPESRTRCRHAPCTAAAPPPFSAVLQHRILLLFAGVAGRCQPLSDYDRDVEERVSWVGAPSLVEAEQVPRAPLLVPPLRCRRDALLSVAPWMAPLCAALPPPVLLFFWLRVTPPCADHGRPLASGEPLRGGTRRCMAATPPMRRVDAASGGGECVGEAGTEGVAGWALLRAAPSFKCARRRHWWCARPAVEQVFLVDGEESDGEASMAKGHQAEGFGIFRCKEM